MVLPERELATDYSWAKTDWFAKPTIVKYRCIIDMLAIRNGGKDVLTIDFKTGKVRPYNDSHGQLHLSAAMVMSVIPQAEVLTSAYVFSEHKQTIKMTMERDEVQKEIDYFDGLHTRVNEETEFAPTKHKYCNFCGIKNTCPLFKKPDFDDDIPF